MADGRGSHAYMRTRRSAADKHSVTSTRNLIAGEYHAYYTINTPRLSRYEKALIRPRHYPRRASQRGYTYTEYTMEIVGIVMNIASET